MDLSIDREACQGTCGNLIEVRFSLYQMSTKVHRLLAYVYFHTYIYTYAYAYAYAYACVCVCVYVNDPSHHPIELGKKTPRVRSKRINLPGLERGLDGHFM